MEPVGGRMEERGSEYGRIFKRDLFLLLLDLEVKRARRYQNFLSLLILKLVQIHHGNNGDGLRASHKILANLLAEDMRETDIIGSLGEDKLVVLLPYADLSAGNIVRFRFETLLKYYDLKNNGFEAVVRQICFPANGTNTIDLLKKALEEDMV